MSGPCEVRIDRQVSGSEWGGGGNMWQVSKYSTANAGKGVIFGNMEGKYPDIRQQMSGGTNRW